MESAAGFVIVISVLVGKVKCRGIAPELFQLVMISAGPAEDMNHHFARIYEAPLGAVVSFDHGLETL